MMKDDQVVVVDFKFGKENPKYNKQVKGYMQLLTNLEFQEKKKLSLQLHEPLFLSRHF